MGLLAFFEYEMRESSFKRPAGICFFANSLYICKCMSTKDIIRGMREIASHVLPKGAEVILFGSRARGDARVDSDWDILILIDGERATCEDFEKFAYPFVYYGWSVGEQINPLIYSFEDWSKKSITPFYKNVQLEGVSLCR